VLKTINLFGKRKNKVDIAIKRIKQFEPPEGYYVAFSGGKDSVVILDLVKRAGVKYDAHYNLTTVDPPELVQFIKTFADVQIDKPEKTMWQLIVENGIPPMWNKKYCCRILKERGGEGRYKITGIRWAESARRKDNRQMTEVCYETQTKTINPIIDWEDEDVWQYIKQYNVDYCKLYDEGYERLGCLFCPEKYYKKRWKDKERYPKYYQAFLRAFDRMLVRQKEKGTFRENGWQTGKEVMNWWINEDKNKRHCGQTSFLNNS
jgi:phosphoadenosine phosphosulfate reductase